VCGDHVAGRSLSAANFLQKHLNENEINQYNSMPPKKGNTAKCLPQCAEIYSREIVIFQTYFHIRAFRVSNI